MCKHTLGVLLRLPLTSTSARNSSVRQLQPHGDTYAPESKHTERKVPSQECWKRWVTMSTILIQVNTPHVAGHMMTLAV